MDENSLLLHTDFNFPASPAVLLLAVKQDEFIIYFPLRRRLDGHPTASLPTIDWKQWNDTVAKTQPSKSIDQFQSEFDFTLVGFANSFSVNKYRYSGNFPEEVRLKLIAADLKSRLHAVSASTEAGKQMSRRFTFYDISKLENLDLENKKSLLFGKKIVDVTEQKTSNVRPSAFSEAPATSSFTDLSLGQSKTDLTEPLADTHPQKATDTDDRRNSSAMKTNDKQMPEVDLSADNKDSVDLKREDFLLVSPPSGLTKGPAPRRYHGVIKVFFDEEKYGFLESPDYGNDVYVSLDELKKAGVTKKTVRKNRAQLYSFLVHEYHRKHKLARKAVDVRMEDEPSS